jgi:hypothetical protein
VITKLKVIAGRPDEFEHSKLLVRGHGSTVSSVQHGSKALFGVYAVDLLSRWRALRGFRKTLGHKRPACMLLFVFLRGGFSIHCRSANEEGVPVPSKPPMAQGQNNRRLAR